MVNKKVYNKIKYTWNDWLDAKLGYYDNWNLIEL